MSSAPHVVEPDVQERARSAVHSRMLEVHTRGRATVSTGARERMEVDVTAMHSYGLRATLESVGDGADGAGGADGIDRGGS